jgi:RNA polymerase sigma-70 factor (ECF subfamily)
MDTFEAFYRDNVRLVHALMRSRTRDIEQAEDLTQDTFLRAWRSFAEITGLEPPAQRAWLLRTARNLSIDVWRRRNLEATASAALAPRDGDRDLPDLRLDVAHALNALEDGDRELVVLRYLEEMNSREIGVVLGIPEGTVRRRLARCRDLLSEHLSQWADDGGAP